MTPTSPELYGNDDGTIPATFQVINMVRYQRKGRAVVQVSIDFADRLETFSKSTEAFRTGHRENKFEGRLVDRREDCVAYLISFSHAITTMLSSLSSLPIRSHEDP